MKKTQRKGWQEALTQRLCKAHRPVFKQLGFELEIKKVGPIKIGLWRKKFSRSRQRARHPRRMIWIPGFGDSPATWMVVILGLQRTIQRQFDELVVFDLPGFHGYMGTEPCRSMDDLLRGVYASLDTLEPQVIFGHSLGGWLAALYAAEKGSLPRSTKRYPGPDTIILANPSGIFGNERLKAQWTKRFETVMTQGFSKFRQHLFSEEPAWFSLVSWQLENFFRREDVLTFMKSIREDHILEGRLKNFHCKTWVIWGEEDTLSPSVWARHWIKNLKSHGKDVQGFVLPRKGHSIQIESPIQTIVLLNNILKQRNPDALSRRWWKEVVV